MLRRVYPEFIEGLSMTCFRHALKIFILHSSRSPRQKRRANKIQPRKIQQRGHKNIQPRKCRRRVDEERAHPCPQRGCGFAAVEQIPRVNSMRGCARASFHGSNCLAQPRLTLRPIQNAEGFAPKLRRFGAVLRLRVITRRRPRLIDVEDFSVLRDSNPQVMVE